MAEKTISNVEFVKGIRGTDGILFNRVPQVAFIGRSNVGKSSVINTLVGRKNLVKESATPGKTTEINFFLVNEKVYFVDLPGYGYAKLPAKKREQLRKMILWYFGDLDITNRRVVLIIDAKVGPTEFDHEILTLLDEREIPVVILANKFDKIKKSEQNARSSELKKTLPERTLIPFSARTGEGSEEVLDRIL